MDTSDQVPESIITKLSRDRLGIDLAVIGSAIKRERLEKRGFGGRPGSKAFCIQPLSQPQYRWRLALQAMLPAINSYGAGNNSINEAHESALLGGLLMPIIKTKRLAYSVDAMRIVIFQTG
jgi:hypothetical protein